LTVKRQHTTVMSLY